MPLYDKKLVKRLEGLCNFRDLGGLETKEGSYLKTGLLFRSDDLARLSKKDIHAFEQLGIKLVFDLRTPQEQKSKPNKLSRKGVQIINIPINDKSREFTPFEFFKFLTTKPNSIDFEGIMKNLYQHMGFGSHAQINKLITLLSDEKNVPALIHCTGGKDRTGFLAAIIQLLAGVPYQAVLEEYMRSNEFSVKRMKKAENFIRWMSLFQLSPDRLKPLLEVRPHYLGDVYEEIMKEYGDIENYLMQACKIPESCLLTLKARLLE